MCEDYSLCTHYKYHKHKIIHFLASMRNYRDLLQKKKFNLNYFEFDSKPHFFKQLLKIVKKLDITKIQIYEIEDKFFEKSIIDFAKKESILLEIRDSPMFLCRRSNFFEYLSSVKKPFLKTFYQRERVRQRILIDAKDKPVGGQWSFDSENRKKIPKKSDVKAFTPPAIDCPHVRAVSEIVEKNFSGHPGSCDNFWIPVTQKSAFSFFEKYLDSRFNAFGDYQDAIDTRCDFLYHSAISPLMNIGFLLPNYVVEQIVNCLNSENLNSVEGFVRQVIGWREFVRGIYQNFSEMQEDTNFFKHNKKLNSCWYDGTTGIPPLDDAIKKAQKWGYCHHIERLMICGNLMLLLELDPVEVHKWFMEMFVDSSDWVMGPNVYGMSQFSDGGLFATKPYISGSNYILKMSHYKKDSWCEGVDGLYWRFIEKHQDFFAKNHRMRMMVSQVKKMDPERKKSIFKAASNLQSRLCS